MQGTEQQTVEIRESEETRDRAELKRAAHKIAWMRMNGSLDAANPFAEADSGRDLTGGRRED